MSALTHTAPDGTVLTLVEEIAPRWWCIYIVTGPDGVELGRVYREGKGNSWRGKGTGWHRSPQAAAEVLLALSREAG